MGFHPKLFGACLALFLALFSVSLYKVHHPPGAIADEAAYLMMTQSLLHDRDLTYTREDLDRVYHDWANGPNGLILITDDGGDHMYYGKPPTYSLVALPFYAVFGVNGFLLLNMIVYAGMGFAGYQFLVKFQSPAVAGIFTLGFFLGAASLAYAYWIQPEVFNMGLVFAAVALWMARAVPLEGAREDCETVDRETAARPRHWTVWAGLALGVAASSKITNGIMILPIAMHLLLRRQWKQVALLVAGGVVACGLFMGVGRALTGHWSPYRGVQRRSFSNEYPYESKKEFWAYGGAGQALAGSWRPRADLRLGLLARNSFYFIFGRHAGLLPYFPFAIAALIYFLFGRSVPSQPAEEAAGEPPRRRSRGLYAALSFWSRALHSPRALLLAGVGIYVLFFFIFRPFNYHGGAGFIGNRYFANVYPCLLFLVRRIPAPASLLLPWSVAGVFAAQVSLQPTMTLNPVLSLQAHTRSRPFQMLPLELTLLGQNKTPSYARKSYGGNLWIVPKELFFTDEAGPGVWMAGASTAQVVVVSRRPLERLEFEVSSLAPSNAVTICSGWESIAVPMDTPEKVQGTRIGFRPRLRARDFGIFFEDGREYYYEFWISCRDGATPNRLDPASDDARFLGVFLRFPGGERGAAG